MIQFYKANPKVTGSACSFKLSLKDDCIYINFIKQATWNDEKKTGTFSSQSVNPKAVCSMKMSSTEIGDMISAMRRNAEFNCFHDSQKQITRMKFSPYLRPSKDDPNSRSQVGYSLAVNKESKEDSQDRSSFIMGFTFGESVKLELFLELSLTKIFEKSIQDQDNKGAQGYSQPNQKVTPKKETPQEAATVADDSDLW